MFFNVIIHICKHFLSIIEFAIKGGMSYQLKKVVTDVAREQVLQMKINLDDIEKTIKFAGEIKDKTYVKQLDRISLKQFPQKPINKDKEIKTDKVHIKIIDTTQPKDKFTAPPAKLKTPFDFNNQEVMYDIQYTYRRRNEIYNNIFNKVMSMIEINHQGYLLNNEPTPKKEIDTAVMSIIMNNVIVTIYFDSDIKTYKESIIMKDRSLQLSNERRKKLLSAANKTISFFYSIPDLSSDESTASSSAQIIAKHAFKLTDKLSNTIGYIFDPLPLGAGSSWTDRRKTLISDIEQYVLMVLPLCLPEQKYYPKTYKLKPQN